MPVRYDPEAGRRAYEEMTNRLSNVTELRVINGKLELAAVAVLRVAQAVEGKQLEPRFASLSDFNIMHLNHLRPLAWALWHCLVELDKARTGQTERQVDINLVTRAKERRTRMLTVIDYHLGDDPIVARETNDIRSGQGYFDLIKDLTRVASLYEQHVAALQGDKRHYHPDDAALARDDAEAILRELADDSDNDAAHWEKQVQRAWSALLESYGEVRAASQWLFRADPDVERRFPPLYGVVRQRSGRRSGSVEAPELPPELLDPQPAEG